MKKGLLIAVALMLAAGAVYATEARDDALSGARWRVKDGANIQLFPTVVLNDKDMVVGELGAAGSGDAYAGVHVGIGPGVLGVYAGNIPMLGSGGPLLMDVKDSGADPLVATALAPETAPVNSALSTLGPGVGPSGRLALIYGMPMGGLNVAGGIEYFSSNWGEEKAKDANGDKLGTASDSAALLNLVLGVSAQVAALDPLEVGVRLGMPSMNAEVEITPFDTTNEYKGSGSGVDLYARGALKDLVAKDATTLVYIGVGMGSLKCKDKTTVGDTTTDNGSLALSANTFDIGVSNNHAVGEGSLIAWGGGISMGSSSNDSDNKGADRKSMYDDSTTAVPVWVNAETKLLSWLTGRLSSVSNVINSETQKLTVKADPEDKSSDELTTDTSSQSVALGLTIKAGEKVDIDAVLQEDWLFCGPYFLGGDSVLGTMFTKISATARF